MTHALVAVVRNTKNAAGSNAERNDRVCSNMNNTD